MKIFVYENKVYSDKKEKISFLNIEQTNLDDIILSGNILNNNKLIIDILEKNKNNFKEFEIYGLIDNFEETEMKIRKIWNEKNNSKIKKIDEPDYEFMEKVSAPEILEQLIAVAENDENLKILKNRIKEYLDKNNPRENSKLNTIEEEIDKVVKEILETDDEIKKFENEEINLRKIKIKEIEKTIENLKLKKEKTNKEIERLFIDKDEQEKVKKLEKEIIKLKNKKEDFEIEIKIINSKIATLKDKIKTGSTKCSNPWLMILTLGLIWWTRFSDCRYKINRLHLKISNIKLKILENEKKSKKLERDIEEFSDRQKERHLSNSKKEEKLNNDLEQLEQELTNENKELDKNQRELELKIKEMDKLSKKKQDFIERKNSIEKIKEDHLKNSLTKIDEKMNELEKKYYEKVNELLKYKEQIEKQKINIKGIWKIELD